MTKIIVKTQVKAPIEQVWKTYNRPDIEQWNTA